MLKIKNPKSTETPRDRSLNACTHGIFTSAAVLRTENNQLFLSLERELLDYWSPVGPSERKLLEEMAVCQWRQQRVWAVESAGIELEMDHDAPVIADKYSRIDEAVRAAIALKNLADNSNFLDLMHRYETRFSRQYDRALRRLLDLQDRRQRQPEPPQRDNSILQNETPAEPRQPAPASKPVSPTRLDSRSHRQPHASTVNNPALHTPSPETASCPSSNT